MVALEVGVERRQGRKEDLHLGRLNGREQEHCGEQNMTVGGHLRKQMLALEVSSVVRVQYRLASFSIEG